MTKHATSSKQKDTRKERVVSKTGMIAFEYLGNKYRATADLKLIERQSPMTGAWTQTHSERVRQAAIERRERNKHWKSSML